MDLARSRIEQLTLRGSLRKWMARRDLRTLEFLERHPDRKFPDDASDWLLELPRVFWIGDPGFYQILRVLVLDGKIEEPRRSQALRSAANFVGAVITLLLYLGLLGMLLWTQWRHAGGAPPVRLDRLANLALFCTMGGVLIAILMFEQFQKDFRKLDEAIRTLD